MEKFIALTAAALLTTSSAALATGISEGSSPQLGAEAGIAAAGAKSGTKAAKPGPAMQQDAAVEPVGAKEPEPGEAALLARTEEEPADALKETAAAPEKDAGQPAYSAFRDVEPYEAPTEAGKAAEGEAMGGPADAADLIAAQWDSYDADGEQGLTRLEFANWAAADTGKAEFGAAAIAERGSAAEDSATVRLLNATSLEFTYADSDDDMRISAEEMARYMEV